MQQLYEDPIIRQMRLEDDVRRFARILLHEPIKADAEIIARDNIREEDYHKLPEWISPMPIERIFPKDKSEDESEK